VVTLQHTWPVVPSLYAVICVIFRESANKSRYFLGGDGSRAYEDQYQSLDKDVGEREDHGKEFVEMLLDSSQLRPKW
jgi:hypothetical protein